MFDCPETTPLQIYMGSVPFILVADADLARTVNNRLIDRSLGQQLTADRTEKDNEQLLGLATAK